jgi:hypothetical protein
MRADITVHTTDQPTAGAHRRTLGPPEGEVRTGELTIRGSAAALWLLADRLLYAASMADQVTDR